jgi:hypothetical protein
MTRVAYGTSPARRPATPGPTQQDLATVGASVLGYLDRAPSDPAGVAEWHRGLLRLLADLQHRFGGE